MNLTANFTLSEMVKSETALRHGMDNTPGETEIENLKRLCEQVLVDGYNFYIIAALYQLLQ